MTGQPADDRAPGEGDGGHAWTSTLGPVGACLRCGQSYPQWHGDSCPGQPRAHRAVAKQVVTLSITGTYEPCPTCRRPPLPEGSIGAGTRVTLRRDGDEYVMIPHEAECENMR